MSARVVKVHPYDTVAIALEPLSAGERVAVGAADYLLKQGIPLGHKFSLEECAGGSDVIKYGCRIGKATRPISTGEWVHTHNLESDLSPDQHYSGHTGEFMAPAVNKRWAFQGFRRKNGDVGIRNELWIFPSVGCVNQSTQHLAEKARLRFGRPVYAFPHPYGCSQLSDDLEDTRKILASLAMHPNAGGVLIMGLGCENNQIKRLIEEIPGICRERLRFFNAQDVVDEMESGMAYVEELLEMMAEDRRVECPFSELVLGMKCGGSDAYSGITANPLVGKVADQLSIQGGKVILTEVPEMFGAEHLLMARAKDAIVHAKLVEMIHGFQQYFLSHGEPIDKNPSPGNLEGGITTLEEKSLGAIQKGGGAAVSDVIAYGSRASQSGLTLLQAPGNDAVSSTALAAAGAHLVLFTTGRGTPYGCPVPTLKIASHTALAKAKPRWIDFNAGELLEGKGIRELSDALMEKVASIASGEEEARNEENGFREIAIWKRGVTL